MKKINIYSNEKSGYGKERKRNYIEIQLLTDTPLTCGAEGKTIAFSFVLGSLIGQM